jgi:hypothetical protein
MVLTLAHLPLRRGTSSGGAGFALGDGTVRLAPVRSSADWTSAAVHDGAKTSRLVFIGRNLNRPQLRHGLAS